MQVNINGIDTRYVLSNEGGGPWLTFIHQLGGDLSIWDQMAGYFRDDYTVLRYDVRGHGHSAVAREPFTMRDLADDLAKLLDALGARTTHLVGLSLGRHDCAAVRARPSITHRHADDCRQHRRHSARES
ncbi:pimeloyl-ACP methyl ester carboxylesterase [Paraburkholderia sp. WSM4175]